MGQLPWALLIAEKPASWTAVPNAGYWYCLDTVDNGQCDSMWWPVGGATTMELGWMGLGAGTYSWQVRSQDDQTGALTAYDGGAWWHFTIGSGNQGLTALGGEEWPGWAEPRIEPLPLSPQAAVTTGAIGLSEGERPEADLTLEPESPSASPASPEAPTAHAPRTGPTDVVSSASTSAASASLLLLEGGPAVMVEYYHLDALGSLRAVTDAAGVLLRRHDFLPFGEEWQPPVPPGDARLFTGKERDAETGLDCFGARYYRADLGRFTTVDPALGRDGDADPQRWNAYAYASNNPLIKIDPDGMRWFTKNGNAIWVEPNKDGTYTSPGEGWVELDPKDYDYRLNVAFVDGTLSYIGEGPQGRKILAAWMFPEQGLQDTTFSLVATVMAAGALVRAGAAILSAARAPAMIFKTRTFGWNLTKSGVDVSAAKAVVQHAIASQLPKNVPAGTNLRGFVTLGGRILEYKARVLPGGAINIGSIRVVQ